MRTTFSLLALCLVASCTSATAPKPNPNLVCAALVNAALQEYGPPIGEGTEGPDTLTFRYAHFTLIFDWSSGTCQENETSP